MFHPEIQAKNRFGYARVSSSSQESNSSIDTQKEILLNQGVPIENIFIEIGSATLHLSSRPVLNELIQTILKSGDILFISRMDRFSRNVLSYLEIQHKLTTNNVHLVPLDVPESDDPAVKQMMSTLLATFSTFETERRKQRQLDGIAIAKKDGKYKGRKSVISTALIKKVGDMRKNGWTIREIALANGVGKTTIYKVLKTKLGYTSNKLIQKNNPVEVTDNETT
jgi:DNA invertase Pin-like site-specific DNA recombinase